MRKRPDYGNATPEDLLRALMTERPKTARYRQSDSGRSDASLPDSEPPAASESECQTHEDCASPQTPERSGQDASD